MELQIFTKHEKCITVSTNEENNDNFFSPKFILTNFNFSVPVVYFLFEELCSRSIGEGKKVK